MKFFRKIIHNKYTKSFKDRKAPKIESKQIVKEERKDSTLQDDFIERYRVTRQPKTLNERKK